MAMTTCKQCLGRVADDAPTCPACGTTAPGEGGAERDAKRKAESAAGERKVWLGCGGLVLVMALLLGGGALYNYVTAVEMDGPAERACSAVTTAQFGQGAIRQAAGRVEAVAEARTSSAEGLQDAAGGPGRVDPDSVSEDYFAVAAWCEEHAR